MNTNLHDLVTRDSAPSIVVGNRDAEAIRPIIARARGSVAERLGAALLGAAEGETVEIEQRDGAELSARIVAVNPGGFAS